MRSSDCRQGPADVKRVISRLPGETVTTWYADPAAQVTGHADRGAVSNGSLPPA